MLFCLRGVSAFQGAFIASSEDTLISFLPLAHMFEKVVEVGTEFYFV